MEEDSEKGLSKLVAGWGGGSQLQDQGRSIDHSNATHRQLLLEEIDRSESMAHHHQAPQIETGLAAFAVSMPLLANNALLLLFRPVINGRPPSLLPFALPLSDSGSRAIRSVQTDMHAWRAERFLQRIASIHRAAGASINTTC